MAIARGRPLPRTGFGDAVFRTAHQIGPLLGTDERFRFARHPDGRFQRCHARFDIRKHLRKLVGRSRLSETAQSLDELLRFYPCG